MVSAFIHPTLFGLLPSKINMTIILFTCPLKCGNDLKYLLDGTWSSRSGHHWVEMSSSFFSIFFWISISKTSLLVNLLSFRSSVGFRIYFNAKRVRKQTWDNCLLKSGFINFNIKVKRFRKVRKSDNFYRNPKNIWSNFFDFLAFSLLFKPSWL